METLKSILPLYFAAPVSWYAHSLNTDCLCIADEQTFERQTLRNRLVYGTFQGARLFSIPLNNHSTGSSYQKVEIDYKEHWQNKLINALQTAYGKSPFFEFYGYRFENIFRHHYQFLWDLNMAILKETILCLKVDVPLELLVTDKIKSLQLPPNQPYYQVFQEKIDFLPELSILDLLYNEGPDAYKILSVTKRINSQP